MKIAFPDSPNYSPQEEAISLRFLDRPIKANRQTERQDDTEETYMMFVCF